MGIPELEPNVRMSISYIENALNYTRRLYGHSGDSALASFDHHAHEAIHQLRLWAAANDLTVLDRMKT